MRRVFVFKNHLKLIYRYKTLSNSLYCKILGFGYDAYTNGPGKNIDIAEADNRELARLPLALNSENVGIALLYGSDISDDPFTTAVCLQYYSASDQTFKLCTAPVQIRANNHTFTPSKLYDLILTARLQIYVLTL